MGGRIIIILSFVFVICQTLSAKKNVAVYLTGDQPENVKTIIGSKMVYYITQSDDFSAIERTSDFLEALSSERDYAVSGEVSNSQIVKLGQQFGARYVAVINATDAFGELYITSRLINVETNGIDASYDAYGTANSISELSEMASKLAEGLLFEPIRKAEAKAKLDEERKQQEEARQRKEAEEKRNALVAQAKRNLLRPMERLYGNYAVLKLSAPVIRDNPEYMYYALPTVPNDYTLADVAMLYRLQALGLSDYYYGIVDMNYRYCKEGKTTIFYYKITSDGINVDKKTTKIHYNKKDQCWYADWSWPSLRYIFYREISDDDIEKEIARIGELK